MSVKKSKLTCLRCGGETEKKNEYCSKCKNQLEIARDQIIEDSLSKQFLTGGDYGIGFKLIIIGIILIQLIIYTLSIVFSAENVSSVVLFFLLFSYLIFVLIFPIIFKVKPFYNKVVSHPDKNIETIRIFIILYFLYVTFFPTLYFITDAWTTFTDVEYANLYTFDYNMFVTFLVIGITSFVLAFAKPMALKFSGRFREASVLNKLVSENVTSYSANTDYIKILFSFISGISLLIVLWKIVMVFDISGFAIFAIIAFILMLISFGTGISSLFNSMGNVE